MTTKHDYVVADMKLAEWGRRELAIAETEMPGLMAIRAEYGPQKPLRAPQPGSAPPCRPGHGAPPAWPCAHPAR